MEKRDFFISYTKQDKVWAVWIAETLKSNGYTAYCQALDIKPGDDFLEKMEEFFDNSENFIAVWSKSYAQSGFCMKEFRAAFNGVEQGWIGCLLPVRIDNYPLKRLYASLVHTDLSDVSAASAEKLMDAVCHAVPRPVTAQEEDAETLYQRGEDYYYGKNDIKQDYIKAREYYERAAAKGHAGALFSLGVLYDFGNGVRQDYAKAREYYKRAAAKGNADALYSLGSLYSNGDGVRQDYAKARDYYKQAVAKGNATALNRLGLLYDKGQGVRQDYAKAREYYEQAATKGNVDALWNLACIYEKGDGVRQDYAKALEYYQKAADAGDEDAPAKVAKLRKKLNL